MSVIQVVSNALIPDHDAEVFNPFIEEDAPVNFADSLVDILFAGLRRWDAVYFLHIAEHGYTYENCLAFFPLFPLTVRTVANTLLFPLHYVLSYSRLLLLTAVFINLFCSVSSTQILYTLGLKVTCDKHLAYNSALLYTLTPASVFTIAPYSESLFSLLSFSAMVLAHKQLLALSALLFGFSAMTRSNGIVALGFVLYFNFQKLLYFVFGVPFERLLDLIIAIFWKIICPMIFQIVLLLAPFLFYQYYTFLLYCKPNEYPQGPFASSVLAYGRRLGLKFPGNETPLSPWCYQKIPVSYTYIQSHYWEVGFLNYFQLKQIPNFLLALPMTCLCLSACSIYYSLRKHHCHYLGLYPSGQTISDNISKKLVDCGYSSAKVFVYGVYTLFFTIFGFFCMHVQVLTRLVASSSPLIYWFSAYLMTKPINNDQSQLLIGQKFSPVIKRLYIILQEHLWKNSSVASKLILTYFIAYSIIGTMAFSNFLPWT